MMADGGMGGDGGDQDTPPTTRFLATPLVGQTNGVPSAFELGYPYNFIANIQKRW